MNQKNDHSIEALLQQGSIRHAQHRLDEAQQFYSQAAALDPADFRAWYLSGIVALQQGLPQRALEYLEHAVRINPMSAESHTERGNALARLSRHEQAIASYDKAIDFAASQPAAHYNRGSALQILKRHEDAIASFDRAISLKPDHVAAINKRAGCLYDLRRYAEAAVGYQRVIELKHDHADAHNNRGNALYRLNQIEAAVLSYDAAIALDSGFAGAFYNRGKILNECRQYAAALDDYEKALALNDDAKPLPGMRLQVKLQICDWRGMDADIARLQTGIETGQSTPSPFTVLAVSGSAALQKQAAENWVREEYPPDFTLPAVAAPAGQRIRIGYFSADFHNHATMQLMAGLFELHDRSKFEVTAFSFGQDSQDDVRTRLKRACENFVEVGARSDEDVARLARDLKIDIAIDLKGFTKDCRPGIFAARCAPLQVSFLGYPGTMGAPYMDYLVADFTVIPRASRRHYSEKIIYLPDCYQVNDSKRHIAEGTLSRQDLGLPAAGFVFCCFNNNYKITPAVFECWMRILRRVEGSVLWLLEDNPTAVQNLHREAARCRLDAQRLIFAQRAAPAAHLARHRAADLFLDTFPCNAHTTASDSLWAGLPVLTCAAEAFAGRVAASLLNALELPELIAADLPEYEELAVMFAARPQALAEILRKLERNRARSSLFDTQRYAAKLEEALSRIIDRHRAGLAPHDLTIEG
jgi:predicted O-linked N-acetylglucosamine transferase (SPINDLY family)